MRGKVARSIMSLLFLLAAGFCLGCDPSAVGDQARASLSSFVTGIVNNTITDIINNND